MVRARTETAALWRKKNSTTQMDIFDVTYIMLTLRLLMSYIYMERIFLMFLDHTQRRTTVGMTPLDE